MRYSLLIVGTLALALVGCSKNSGKDSTGAQQEEQLLPLKVGNIWTYALTDYNENGSTSAAKTVTLIVSGKKTYFGNEYFVIADQADLTDTVFAFRSEKDRLLVPNFYVGHESTLFKWPVTDGEVLIDESSGSIREVNVASATPITINSFTGYKVTDTVYSSIGIEYYQEMIFSPGIGLIGLNDFHHKSSSSGFYKIQDLKLMTYHQE